MEFENLYYMAKLCTVLLTHFKLFHANVTQIFVSAEHVSTQLSVSRFHINTLK